MPTADTARTNWGRRGILLVLVVALGWGGAALGEGRAVEEGAGSAERRPNILLLVAEDLSPRIGAAGDPVAVTPHIDRLAERGVRYPRAFTTTGVCAPSRAALITGMHAVSVGAQHMRTSSRPEGGYRAVPPAGVKAFPELLRGRGYYTFTTHKLDYGFSDVLPGSGPFTIWDVEDAETLWSGRAAGQPFFGLVNFMETHESGVFRPLGRAPNSAVHLVMQVWRAWNFGLFPPPAVVRPEDVPLPPYYPDAPAVREDIARHYANIAAMDQAVGDLLARLEADGLADQTIVIFTTDHGDGLPRAKRELYDSGLHVPLILAWPEALRPPNVEPGTLDHRLVSFVDLAPTILELAGVAPAASFQGQSFLGDDRPRREAIYASRDRIDEVSDRQRAVRDDRFKYIRSFYPERPGGHPLAFRDNLEMMQSLWALRDAGALNAEQSLWFEPPGEERLFDTQADPYELRNLAGDPRYAGVLERMRERLVQWQSRVGDTGVSEGELVARFETPPTEESRTPIPSLELSAGTLVMSSPTPGASLGYSVDEGAWKLYVAPVEVSPGQIVRGKAVRYGWDESDIATLRIPSD